MLRISTCMHVVLDEFTASFGLEFCERFTTIDTECGVATEASKDEKVPTGVDYD